MYLNNFRKYVESIDVSKVSKQDLTFPSQNFFFNKGTLVAREGIEQDVTDATTDTGILGEYTWKDQKGGERAVRAFVEGGAGYLQLKLNEVAGWINIYDDINPDTLRVRFATWLDSTSTIIKKRLYFVDGSDSIHEWNGAVATIASIAGDDVTIAGSKTLLQLGFDSGATVDLKIVRFETDGTVKDITDYQYNDDCTDGVLHLTSTPTLTPIAGDLIIATPKEHTTVLSGVIKDDIWTYKNHLLLASLTSEAVYASSIETPLDYVIPVPASRTAISPFTIYLTGNYTAMISRKDKLWISTADEWIKVTKTADQNQYDQWVDIENFEQPERNGALPFAVAKYKTDVIFLSQDKKLQRITTLEITGQDDLMLLSDDVEDLLLRLDLDEARLYYDSRYVYITVPRESKLLMLDMIGFPELGLGAFWQPPQTIPISYIQRINGVRYGHSNSQNITFTLFSGTEDLGAPIESIFAFGFFGDKDRHNLMQFSHFGIDGRINERTIAKVTHAFESDSMKGEFQTVIDGGKIKLYSIPEDVNWGFMWALRAWAGGDLVTKTLKRFFTFDKVEAVSWFEYRPIIKVSGKYNEFHILGLSWNIDQSTRKKDDALFISKL